MRATAIMLSLAIWTGGCSDRNLLGQPIPTEEELAKVEIGFGWNFDVESKPEISRNFDVAINTDDDYEITLSEYRFGQALKVIDRKSGRFAASEASRLRQQLAQLRPAPGTGIFATLPNCPEISHPPIEYYVGFGSGDSVDVTIIERTCSTPETKEARRLLERSLSAIPSFDRTELEAGGLLSS